MVKEKRHFSYCGISSRLLLIVIVIYIFTLLNPLLFQVLKRLSKHKKPIIPYVKSVEFKCSNLRNGTAHLNLVPHIKFRLYIITHDDFSANIAQQWSRCMPFVEILKISTTPFMESYAYASILSDKEKQKEWAELDFVGLATYKSLKFLPIEKLEASLMLAYYGPFEFVPLYNTGENLLPQAIGGHTHDFKDVWYAMLAANNFSDDEIHSGDNVEVFLRNTFITTPHWMVKLCAFMKRSIHIATTNKTLSRILASNAHYREAKSEVSSKVFHNRYGIYHWHPFVLERLPAFFVYYWNVSVFGSLYQSEWFENTRTNNQALYKGL